MKIEVMFPDGRHFDGLFRGIVTPDFEADLSITVSVFAAYLKDSCRIEFILDNGERLELSLIPPVSI